MTTHYARPASAMSTPEILSEIATIEGTLGMAFKQMGPDYDASKITVFDGDTAAKSQMVRELNARLADLRTARSNLPAEGTRRITPLGYDAQGGDTLKSLGERIVAAPEFRKNSLDFEVPWSAAESKADFTTSTGWVPESGRASRLAESATRPVSGLLDLIGTPVRWEQASYPFMRETTYNPGAVVETAEGAAFGEAELVMEEAAEPIRKIPVFLPVTDEALADSPQARAYIDGRLTLMIRQRLDLQLLVGDGTAPNLSGFMDRGGLQTQAKGADPAFDAIHKAITKIETVGFALADGVVMNPTDWEAMRLTRTADGEYIMGNPAEIGPKTIFGLPVVTTTAMPENTALVGAFRDHSDLVERTGLEIRVSDSHSDYFVKGRQAIRAEIRVGLAVYREAAFCEVTGI